MVEKLLNIEQKIMGEFGPTLGCLWKALEHKLTRCYALKDRRTESKPTFMVVSNSLCSKQADETNKSICVA
jgi:hypothetical protein